MENNALIIQDVDGQSWSFVLRDGIPFVTVPANEQEAFSLLFPDQEFWFGLDNKWLNGSKIEN